jgi:hypothetical protein
MSASAGARRAAHRLRPRGPCRSARAASGPLDLSEIGAARNAATAGRRPLQRRRSQARLADLLADRAPVDTKANLKVEILDLDTTGELRARVRHLQGVHDSLGAPGTLKIPMTFDPTAAAGAAPLAFRFTAQGTAPAGRSTTSTSIYGSTLTRKHIAHAW